LLFEIAFRELYSGTEQVQDFVWKFFVVGVMKPYYSEGILNLDNVQIDLYIVTSYIVTRNIT
jgi:hypothetical protein